MGLTEERELHAYAMNYEYFLSRAFKFDGRISRAHKQEFLNLSNAESGKKLSFLPNFEHQLEEVKDRLKRAIEIYISKSNKQAQIIDLTALNTEISKITSYKDIPKIVEEGLDVTKNFI